MASKYKLVPVERCAACGNEKPVSEMETCMHAQMHRYVCDLKCMIDFYNPPKNAAAPAVQGEPVGEVRFELGAPSSIYAELYSETLPSLAPGTKLYTAPQPAELKPSVDDSPTPVPDELFAAEFNAWWEQHGQFCRAGGGDYERTFAFEAWRHLYPQLMNLQMAAAEQQPISHDWDDQDKCRRCGDRDWYASATCSPKQQPAPDVDVLVKALEEIIDPARFLQEWLEEGESLNGMAAMQLAKDASYLRGIAIAALAAYKKQGGEEGR